MLDDMQKKLIIVCDDAGFASVDRGIHTLADKTGKPLCADYLIEQEGAVESMKAMSTHPLVSIGLHFELFGMTDADRVALRDRLATKNTFLGAQPDIQERAKRDARRQLKLFRTTLGRDPAHIGTHGNFNTDAENRILPWWTELMEELFGAHVPPMQLQIPHVRHNLYKWNLPATARSPRTPEEFGKELQSMDGNVVEFVLHPALPQPDDASLDMLFTGDMRIADLEAAILIINSGIIERSGFEIVPVSTLTQS